MTCTPKPISPADARQMLWKIVEGLDATAKESPRGTLDELAAALRLSLAMDRVLDAIDALK